MDEVKVSGVSYYDALPHSGLRVGDIWSGLPAFGHLKRHEWKGLVITPACDLANRKAESVTYLPVISVADYLCGRGFAPEFVRVIKGQAPVAGISLSEAWDVKGAVLPPHHDITAVSSYAAAIAANSKLGQKARLAGSRIEAASAVLQGVLSPQGASLAKAVACALGDKEHSRYVQDIIRNAYAADIHFLPADGRKPPMSVIEEHSVVLFRYPVSLPIEVLELADNVRIIDWQSALEAAAADHPVLRNMSARPVRQGALKPRFLPDLISRFAALHIRMGSPDFSVETVKSFATDMGVTV
ncbi:MAG: hypothetical protein ACYC0F_00205 [Rhodanobacter sp.]